MANRFGRLCLLPIVSAIALAQFQSSLGVAADRSSQAVDIRDCRLDTYTFVDDAFGSTFEVSRVGRQGTYKCGEGIYDTRLDPECDFFGDTVLAGTLTTKDMRTVSGESQTIARDVLLTWSRIPSASPCCYWTFEGTGNIASPESRKGSLNSDAEFTWLTDAEMPTLREAGFNRVDPDLSYGSGNFREQIPQPLHPTTCTLGKPQRPEITITAQGMYTPAHPDSSVAIGEILSLTELGRRFSACRVSAEYFLLDDEGINTTVECNGASTLVDMDDSGRITGFWTKDKGTAFKNGVQVGDPMRNALGNEAYCDLCAEDESAYCKPTETSHVRYDLKYDTSCSFVPVVAGTGCTGRYYLPACAIIARLGLR